MLGGSGGDEIFGHGQWDTTFSGGGDDLLYGRPGADMIYAGGGDDQVYVWDDRDLVDWGLGSDTIYVSGPDQALGSIDRQTCEVLRTIPADEEASEALVWPRRFEPPSPGFFDVWATVVAQMATWPTGDGRVAYRNLTAEAPH